MTPAGGGRMPGDAAPGGPEADVDTAVEQDRLPALARHLVAAARRHGTPIYCTDVESLARSAHELSIAFPDPWIRQYSLKANDVPVVVARLGSLGLGANVVSLGEWSIARRAGFPNERITLEGIGKTDAELAAAVAAARAGDPIRWVALESLSETVRLRELASEADLGSGRRSALDVLFRFNPEVSPETHAGLAVGAPGSKFGMTEAEVGRAIEAIAAAPGALRPRGLHLHVGSQLGAIDAWRDAVRRGLALLALLRGNVDPLDTLDVGGGFPVAPLGTPSPSPARFARELPALLEAVPAERRPSRLAIEPGRFLVARAGWLVASVLHVRDRGIRQVVVDAGMTELIRPALYGARHDVVALTSLGRPVDHEGRGATTDLPAAGRAQVEGPICESTDHLGIHELPPLERGDLVAIRDAGAYAASLGSRYNGRPRPAQILIEPDGRLVVGRRRGSIETLP
jgi:diaminopimelate decarboxylase